MLLTFCFQASSQQHESDGGPSNYDSVYKAAIQARQKKLASLSPVTDEMLRHPNDGDWLAWRRTNQGLGYSPLSKITTKNVGSLAVACSWTLPESPDEITPLVHDGIIYVESADRVQALDGETGSLLWEYSRALPEAFHHGAQSIVKNLAIYHDRVIAPTPDGHLVALDAHTGKLIWDHTVLGDVETANHLRIDGGPMIAKGKIIQGVSNCPTYKGGCFIVALDSETGQEAWRFYTIARPGQPGGDSWNGAPLTERFGASVWTSGSYDPDLNLLFYGVGQTYDAATLLSPHMQQGSSADALYTDSTLAINPDNGKLVWFYQHFRRDTWDFDWVFEQSLIDLSLGGVERKLLVTGGKIGIFDTLDRVNGHYVSSKDVGLQTLVTAIDPNTGEKTINPKLIPIAGKTQTICPHSGGARSWPATAYDPATHNLVIPLTESCMDYTWKPGPPTETANGGKDIFWVLKPRPDSDGNFGRLEAIDLETGKVSWTKRRRAPETSSLLTTGGGLIFDGARDRYFRASETSSGDSLWEMRLNAVPSSSPVTYLAGGKQYVAVVAGGGGGHEATWASLTPEIDGPQGGTTLWVFKLPQAR